MGESKHFLRLHSKLEAAIFDYNMIERGDKVLVALSGGKDSTLLLQLLVRKKIKTTNNYSLVAVFVKQFLREEPKVKFLEDLCKKYGVEFHVIDESLEKHLEKDPKAKAKNKVCYLCSRTRRLAMLRFAGRIGANKITLGHHKDDFLETFLMNQYFSGKNGTIKPFHKMIKGKETLIRPLMYIDEKEIIKETKDLEIIETTCKHYKDSERKWVKKMIKDLETKDPKIKKNLFRSMWYVEGLLKEPSRKV